MPSTTAKSKTIRLGIIGTGGMANEHVRGFSAAKGCTITAACDVDAKRVKDFAERHGIPSTFDSAESLLASGLCDAVSIVTPDPFHTPLSLLALKAGMHVLCEKPLALNYQDASRMVKAARKSGRVNMVNFSYRNWPCLEAVAQAVRQGRIGEIRHVEASYLQAWLASKIWGDWRTNPAWLWRLSSKHGSKGVLGDVGVHILDFATYPVGPIKELYCRLKTFPKATANRIGDYLLDANDSAAMTVEFTNGTLGVIHTSRWVGGHANRLFLKIAGTKGTLEIDSDRSVNGYRACLGPNLDKGIWEEVSCKPTPSLFQRFVVSIQTQKMGEPDFARGAEIQRLLDASFESDALGKPVRLRASTR